MILELCRMQAILALKEDKNMKSNKIYTAITLIIIVILLFIIYVLKNRYTALDKQFSEFSITNEQNTTNIENSYKTKIVDLEKENEELKDELEKKKDKVVSLKSKLKKYKKETMQTVELPSTQNYLKIKFWLDGYNYQLSNEDQKIYKDAFLSKKVSNKRIFISSSVSSEQLENGQVIYSAMTSKGLVYSSEYINLSKMESSNSTLSSNAISSEENQKYKKIRFWKTNEEKKLSEYSDQKWYTDYTLSNEVKNSKSLRIVSEVDDFIAPNKVHLYCALTKNGELVYMHESPTLETINE